MRKLLNKFLASFGYYYESVLEILHPNPTVFEASTPQIKEGTMRDAYSMVMKSHAKRIVDFQASPVRIESAREMFLNPTFSDMYWAVRNEKPTGFTEGSMPTDIGAAMMLGRIQGYETAMLNWNRLCNEPEKRRAQVLPTYGADKILREQGYKETE